MPSLTDKIVDDVIRHSINLQRLDAGMRKELITVLNILSRDIVGDLTAIAPTDVSRVYAQRRANKFIAVAAERLNKTYGEMERILVQGLKDSVQLEGKFQEELINGKIQVGLVTGTLAPEVVTAIVTGTELLRGERLHKWFLAEKRALRRVLEGVVNEGVTLGTPIPDMVRLITGTKAAGFKDGIMRQARTRMTTIVRTAANAINNAAKDEIYSNNSDVIKGKQWLSTLDTHTSDICIALDHEAWFLDGKRMPGTVHLWKGPPPAHPNCRSVLIPIVKSWSDLNRNPAIRQRLKAVEKRLKPIDRAAMDGQRFSGAKGFESWLGTQSKTTQLSVLGRSKFELWKADRLTLKQLIDQNHRPLSVAELNEKYGFAA